VQQRTDQPSSTSRAVPKSTLRSIALVFPLFWNVSRRVNLPPAPGTIGPYYIEWTGSGTLGEDWTGTPFDDDGVILSRDGAHYLPVRIAQYGLQQHNEWLRTRGDACKQRFLRQAIWFRDHQRINNGVAGCYVYDVAEPDYLAQPPWISALAQSEAISLLMRAEETQPGAGFLEAARRAAEPFRFDLAHGGVVWRAASGAIFFEEYPVAMAPHVFNGNMYALIGLIELSWRFCEPWIAEAIAAGIASLKLFLPRFDAGFWTFYSGVTSEHGFRRVCTLKYHAFHIALLRVLASLTGEAELGAAADRFMRYQRSWYCRARVWLNMARWLVLKHTHLDDFSAEKSGNVFPENRSPA
jgi:heparosan-N-sulfate-glucuronate 5-epimerase